MSSTKSQLTASISAFGAELSSFVQRASDSITALKRTAEQRPQAGVQDFKECLEDLEQQVADFTDEVQQLAQYTSESISFEELIGHCSAVYSINRATVLALEQHLAQYGYQQPADAVLEPESLQGMQMLDDTEGLCTSSLSMFSARTRQACSTPTSPVSKLRGGAASGHLPSRLGRSQPGSPTAAYAAAADLCPTGDTRQPRDSVPLSTLRGLGAGAGAGVLQTQLRAQQQQQQQQSRVSLGSNTSSTPAGLMISPGVAALANKYATSSVGGSSVGALSLPEQPSTGPPGTSDAPRRSPVRDLNLSYALADVHSPDLPIFGRTSATPPAGAPAGRGAQHWQQQEPETPLGQQQGRGSEEDSTGQLYSSLIHSNMQGMGRGGATADTPEMEVTPPCTRSGVSPCGSPIAPPTAGRLPPTWVSEKMQQLEDLQADVTLTLSQMKRCPSRSRTRSPTPAASEDGSDGEAEAGPALAHQQQQQQQQQGNRAHSSAPGPQTAAGAITTTGDAAARGASTGPQAAAPAATRGVGSSKAAQVPSMQHKSSRAAPAADSLAAQAAAASADLETLMASLSMKYALSSDTPPAAASAAPDAGADTDTPQDSDTMEVDPEAPSPSSPVASTPSAPGGPNGRCADSAGKQQPACAGVGVGGSSLLTPATQQTIRRVVALGGTAARPQSSIRRMQPTTDVHRLEEIRGFYQAGMLPQQLEARLTSAEPGAAAACAGTARAVQEASGPGSSAGSSGDAPAASAEAEQHTVLRQVQVQDHAAAGCGGDASVHAAAGLRQGRQRQQQEKPKQQQQSGEALTPRAARLQRRLMLQQQQQQHPVQQAQCDAENTCPAGKGMPAAAPAPAPGSVGAGEAAAAAAAKLQGITADEFVGLPSWCRSLLSVDLLNSVLQELSAGRCGAGAGAEGGFTADDVALLGHSSSKSKTIVSCLHKLGRATLQRSAAGANVYKLAAAGGS